MPDCQASSPAGPGDAESPIAAFVRTAADRAAMGDWDGAARIIAGAVDTDSPGSDALYFAALAVLSLAAGLLVAYPMKLVNLATAQMSWWLR